MRLLTTLAASPHLPDPSQKTVLSLGLQQLDPSSWLQVDGDYPQFYRHKIAAFKQYPDKVYFAEEKSITAQQELHQLVVKNLQQHYPQHLPELGKSPQFESLWQTSLLVQEDICLLEKTSDHYCLSAASVCSPSNWQLEKKRGGSLDFIHQPVPGYQQELSGRVNRLFDKLKSDAPLLRYNWSLQADNELCWRDDIAPQSSINKHTDTVSQNCYWRVERQTLRRLPLSGAIIFTIRIYLHPLSSLPEIYQQHLWKIISALPEEQRAYKGLLKSSLNN